MAPILNVEKLVTRGPEGVSPQFLNGVICYETAQCSIVQRKENKMTCAVCRAVASFSSKP